MESDSTPRQQPAADGSAWSHANGRRPHSYEDDSVPTSAASTAPTTPDTSRPTTPTISRYSRLQRLSNGNGGAAHHSSKLNGGQPQKKSNKGFLSVSLKGIHGRLDARLKAQAERDSVAGAAARSLLQAGAWAEEVVENEWESRRGAVGGIDNMWILMSNTTSDFNPVCTATYTFDAPLDYEDAKTAIERQVVRFPRYRQKLQDYGRRWHGARFVEDPNWSVERHLSVKRLPEPAGPRELEAFTGDFIAQDWDFSKPLWEGVLLENFNDPESGARGAMVTRGHHTLADGVGFVMSQLYITSYGPEMERLLKEGAQTLHEARRGSAKPSKLHKALRPLDEYRHQLQIPMFLLYWGIFAFQTLLEFYGSFYQAFITSVMFLLTFWRQRYVTNWAPGRIERKEFSASKTFPMEDVKKLQRAFSGPRPGSLAEWLTGDKRRKAKSRWGHLTLNDVLCTILSDVIADELDHRGRGPGAINKLLTLTDHVLPNPIGVFIPINIRPIEDTTMRNWSTGAIAYLPTSKGLPTSVNAMHARLHANKKRLSVVKQGLLPRLFFFLGQMTGQTPILFPSSQWKPIARIVRFWEEVLLSSFTAVVTNVPGPAGDVQLAGREVRRWTALPPQAGKQTLGIGIISAGGRISISVAADKVEGTEGAARRITAKFEKRWAQYLEVADEILQRAK